MKKIALIAFAIVMAYQSVVYALQINNNFGNQGYAYGVAGEQGFVSAFTTNDKIITLSSRAGQLVLSRYNYTGRLDSTFGGDGRQFVSIDQGTAVGKVLVKPLNGNDFYVGGVVTRNGNDDIFIAAFRQDGTLRNDFANAGVLIISRASQDTIADMFVYGDGRVLFAGNYGQSLVVGRFSSLGAPDATVDPSGIYAVNIAFKPTKIALDPAAQFVYMSGESNRRASVYRYTSNNLRPDINFGERGFASYPLGNAVQSSFNNIVFQFDGKLVATGVADGKLVVARMSPVGILDNQFDNDGYVLPALPGMNHVAKHISPMFDGRLFMITDNARDLYFAQLTTSGNFDARYGAGRGYILYSPMAPLTVSKVIDAGKTVLIAGTQVATGQPALGYFNNESCGNATIEPGEDCDDGNLNNADGCSNVCRVASCGNGARLAPEECDDGNAVANDACSNNCRNPRCGDGLIHGARGELCDDGNLINGDGCSAACTTETYCGNARVDNGEVCDDGNFNETDGCTTTCKRSGCGDGFIQAGEECDLADQNGGAQCSVQCRVPRCGNSVVEAGEQCDDGNQLNTDACLNSCQTPRCGDGFVRAGREQCDDANQVNTDGCTNVCQTARCGDGFIQAGEQCDLGAGNINSGACLPLTCQNARCGDGQVQRDVEQCDDGNANNADGCTNQCSQQQACGIDTDGDGLGDGCDICPQNYNPNQRDNDNDGIGDVCDTDDDNDGLVDAQDPCFYLANGNQAQCTLAVTTNLDNIDEDNLCTLREAIEALNRKQSFRGCSYLPGMSIISLPVGHIELTMHLQDIQVINLNGQVLISTDLVIQGSDRSSLAILGDNNMQVDRESSVLFDRMTIQDSNTADFSILTVAGQAKFKNTSILRNSSGPAATPLMSFESSSVVTLSGVTFRENRNGIHVAGNLGIESSTIARNEVASLVVKGQGRITIKNSIMVENGVNNCELHDRGVIVSGGYNAYAVGQCGIVSAQGDIRDLPTNLYGLNALAANGGQTLTIALSPDSHLIDVIPEVSCSRDSLNALIADQRGIQRPQDGNLDGNALCDIGSFELVPANNPGGNGDDTDSDGRLNGQDNCPNTANPDQVDSDGDGIGNVCDNCAEIANANQADVDLNGKGDVCDDSDGDGIIFPPDNCPQNANFLQLDGDRDGLGNECDNDLDNDGVLNNQDNCPVIANADQEDFDGDGIGFQCDNNDEQPQDPNLDSDADGTKDSDDNCPQVVNPAQTDDDSDGLGDLCDPDDDNDGIADQDDNCPEVSNNDQANADGDDRGNACDNDNDNDGVLNGTDNCLLIINADQSDVDGDNQGDVCDPFDNRDILIPDANPQDANAGNPNNPDIQDPEAPGADAGNGADDAMDPAGGNPDSQGGSGNASGASGGGCSLNAAAGPSLNQAAILLVFIGSLALAKGFGRSSY